MQQTSNIGQHFNEIARKHVSSDAVDESAVFESLTPTLLSLQLLIFNIPRSYYHKEVITM